MFTTMQGVIHGRAVELTDDPGLPDGQVVEVLVRPVMTANPSPERRISAAGSLADIPGLDEAMEEIQRERKSGTFREEIE